MNTNEGKEKGASNEKIQMTDLEMAVIRHVISLSGII